MNSEIGLDSARPSTRPALSPGLSNLLMALILFTATAVIFWPSCRNEFVAWDDPAYVYSQQPVLDGITWDGIVWAFTSIVVNNWHPLTMLSLQLDAQLFGIEAYGFHRTAVLLHALNAVLAFWTFLALTGARWKSALVALLFAIHPLRVESVAWISERKDLLSGFFFFLTILAYVHYVRRPSPGRYLLVCVNQALGLASKSMLVTLPCVLLLLDYWPLERMKAGRSDGKWPAWRAVLIEKIPLFLLTLAFCVVTIRSQQSAMSSWPLRDRIANSWIAYAVYLKQTILPLGLSTFYGRHEIRWIECVAALMVMVCVTMFAIWRYRSDPYLIVGWLWFVGMLVPVIGLIQVGKQVHADRYTYLPQLGLWLAIVWSGFKLARGHRWRIAIASVLLAFFSVGCVWLTQKQIAVWKDSETIWAHAIQLDADEKFPLRNLMLLNFMHGKTEEAVRLAKDVVRTSVQLEPSDINSMMNSAMFLSDSGQHAASLEIYDKLMKSFPGNSMIVVNRAKARAAYGDWKGAAEDYLLAKSLVEKSESLPFYLAHALEKSGDHESAVAMAKAAIRQSPNWPSSAAKMAYRLATDPKIPPSPFWIICLAEQANLATEGRDPEVLQVLSIAYALAGRFDEATEIARRALELAQHGGSPELREAIQRQISFSGNHQRYKP